VTLFNRGLIPDDFSDKVKRVKGDRYDYKAFYQRLKDEHFDAVGDMLAYRAEDSQVAVETFKGYVSLFIHISTGSVYIVTRDFPCPLHEEDFDRELLPEPKERKAKDNWLYGYHKRQCEEVLGRAYQEHGFPAMILRLPIIIGERDYTLRAYSYFIRIQDGNPLILPDSGMNVFTHVYQGDVVKTIATNLKNEKIFGQAYNLAQEEILSVRSFILKAAQILEKKVELVDIPSHVLNEISLGTDFSPFSTCRPFILSTEKAKQDMNFSSTPFEVWLRKTIRWFMEDYQGGPPENYQTRSREIEVAYQYREAIQVLKK